MCFKSGGLLTIFSRCADQEVSALMIHLPEDLRFLLACKSKLRVCSQVLHSSRVSIYCTSDASIRALRIYRCKCYRSKTQSRIDQQGVLSTWSRFEQGSAINSKQRSTCQCGDVSGLRLMWVCIPEYSANRNSPSDEPLRQGRNPSRVPTKLLRQFRPIIRHGDTRTQNLESHDNTHAHQLLWWSRHPCIQILRKISLSPVVGIIHSLP